MSDNITGKEYLQWVDFYMEFADKLYPFAEDRDTLIEKVKAVYEGIEMKLPTLEKGGNVVDIDPFTIFGLFNKGITIANRITIIRGFAQEFDVKATVPESFDGIPVLNNQKATFYWFVGGRGEHDIDNLWGVFISALDYTKTRSAESRENFIQYYNAAIMQKGVKWNLTMGLYWIRPYDFINLDSRSRWYITNPEHMPADFVDSIGAMNEILSAEEYLNIIDASRNALDNSSYPYKNYPQLSTYAWKVSEEANEESRAEEGRSQQGNTGKALVDEDVDTIHYWIYSPGANASMWNEFYDAGIMAIGWGEIGDLSVFESKDAMKKKMKERIDPSLSYKLSAHATWQFANEMKPGDIVFAKKGMHKLVGRGVVSSDYEFDPSREGKYKNIRQVDWTHEGEWDHPGQAVMKTLTDITPYTDYVEKLSSLFIEDMQEDAEEADTKYPEYTSDDFLSEVYMSAANYEILTTLVKNKKNVILQGPPGVGKTFVAKRLAYSIIGEKNQSRVKMVQFHQSYSYEDFIMGYRPETSGFERREGPFYKFCKDAEMDTDNDYFFIIDEINRGNLSKIFGELFMLIENDKRDYSLNLLYSGEKFSVPPNVHIIGTMNTADRSLAMLDYALRRRFAFFEFVPAFEVSGFQKYRQEKNNKKLDNLIIAIEQLNAAIVDDETLGKGFRIGHSYFCTEKDVDDMWLHAVITYEIIPLLHEYWFDEPNKVRDWEQALHEAIQ